MRRRAILIAATLLMVAGTVAYAAGGQESAAGTDVDGVRRIQILNGTNWPVPSDVDVNDNPWANVYKEAFPDIEIDWVIVPNTSLQEKINILMATGEMPDLVPTADANMITWADQGLIVPLDEYVADYFPNQDKWFNEGTLQQAFYDGKQYRLLTPRNDLENTRTLQVRSDWLEALDMEKPTTTEEALELMVAFTYEDPDGNGFDDTVGFTGAKNLNWTDPFFNAFGVHQGFWSEVDGTILPDIILPEMKEALAFLREMYELGVYDKDSLVQANLQVEEKATAGIPGLVCFASWGVASRIRPALQERGADLVPLEPLNLNDKGMYRRFPGVWARYSVTAASEHPEAPVQIINWLLDTDESLPYNNINGDKINSGELGVHSELNEAGTFLTELSHDSSPQAEYDVYRFSYRLAGGYVHVAPTEELAAVRLNGPDILAIAPYGHYSDRAVPGPVESELMGELETYFDEVKMEIVTGNAPLDAFDEWVDFFYENGGQDIVDEVNELN